MKLIDYNFFTNDQLKQIRDNIDRRIKENSTTITPPIAYIKVISNVDMANSLDKKGLMHNKFEDGIIESHGSIDEIVEQNFNSTSGTVAYSSIYRYYGTDKASLATSGDIWYRLNNHAIRPLFLFKE